MKRIITYCALGLLGSLFLNGCELDDSNYVETYILDTEVTSMSDCKVYILEKTASTDFKADAKVYYQYNEDTKELTLTHENAAFNCCPGEVESRAILRGSNIVVAEVEQTQGCNCTCLYDITIVINDIEKKGYVVKFNEPYLGNQVQISFVINLAEATSGSATFARDLYPWVG
ncbi:MAG TPA: hypothetical protein PLJ52_00760 [Tenuifilaceae bacterium]|nr:hypothetical protein [Tenuifilaceae bacterium]